MFSQVGSSSPRVALKAMIRKTKDCTGKVVAVPCEANFFSFMKEL
jgi:ABC-type taurine transport system substrate-binding protein